MNNPGISASRHLEIIEGEIKELQELKTDRDSND